MGLNKHLIQRLICGWLLLAPSQSAAAWTGLRRQVPGPSEIIEGSGANDMAVAAVKGGQAAQSASQDSTQAVRVAIHGVMAKDEVDNFVEDTSEIKPVDPDALIDDGNQNYIVASFPDLMQVNYVLLPDLVWRPLIKDDIIAPHAMVIDEDRSRLYLADTGHCKIFWYSLTSLPTKVLMTSGPRHIAVSTINARNIALDLNGNLWYSGASTPVPPYPSVDGIWKQSLLNIDQSASTGIPLDPLVIWSKDQLSSSPSPLVLDAFNIFYGNNGNGKMRGSVIKTLQTVPAANPTSALHAMADNKDVVYSVAVTPTALFYGVDNGIYGVLKTKAAGSCGANGAQCTKVSGKAKKPTAMIWDGDGSIYVADAGLEGIFVFASGSPTPHSFEKIIDAQKVWGMDIFRVSETPKTSQTDALDSWFGDILR